MKHRTIYTAWIWRGDPGPGVERRQSRFGSLVAARRWLAQAVGDWPEAAEYGIDHRTPENEAVADFLSDGIQERIKSMPQ